MKVAFLTPGTAGRTGGRWSGRRRTGPDLGQADRPSASDDRSWRAVAKRSSRRIAAGSSSSSTSSGGTFEPRASAGEAVQDVGRGRHEVQRPGERARQVARRRIGGAAGASTSRVPGPTRAPPRSAARPDRRRRRGGCRSDRCRVRCGRGAASARAAGPARRPPAGTREPRRRRPNRARRPARCCSRQPAPDVRALLHHHGHSFSAPPHRTPRSPTRAPAARLPCPSRDATGGIGRNTHLRMGARPHGQPRGR